jgi:YfiH family protein
VHENRRRFVADCGLPAEPAWLAQVHGNTVVVDPPAGTEADALMTINPDTVCAIMVADCLPVLFCTADGSAVAAAHAGWRGLAAGVLENTISQFGVAPERLLAWLGPAISQAAFEVGDEVRSEFVGQHNAAGEHFVRNASGRWQADLYGLARLRLEAAGVGQIFGGGLCTFGDAERFFSYRRDGQCGRMAAFIFRRP